MALAATNGEGWAVDVLLVLGVASAFVCVAGVVVMRTTFDRLHYAAAGTTVPAFLILAAVIVREHVSSGGLSAIAAVGLMFLLNPVLLTATARAARRIDYGDLAPRPDEIEREDE
jgi:monovalent cation/proton antiporter MnhG/PhaG subunit